MVSFSGSLEMTLKLEDTSKKMGIDQHKNIIFSNVIGVKINISMFFGTIEYATKLDPTSCWHQGQYAWEGWTWWGKCN